MRAFTLQNARAQFNEPKDAFRGFKMMNMDSKDYWYRLKKREAESRGIELSTFCRQLKLPSADGKKYETDCANTESLFRIIQSIMSLNRLTQELTERLTRDYWNKVLNRTIKSYS
jgi:hypothetical protein